MSKLQPAPLVAAATKLAEEGIYGLVWLDVDLAVTARYGQLVSFVEIGDPISDHMPVLISYETDIKALGYDTGNTLFLPAVSIVSDAGHGPRCNLTVIRHKDSPEYIVLVARALSGSTTDVELSQQMRKRLIAEEALAQTSKELALANQDLEDYAAIISHDMSAPLRSIRYLSDDAHAAIEAGDSARALELLKSLKEYSRRISGMMTALLDYASATRKSDVLEDVDTKELLHTIIVSLAPKSGARIEIKGDWPKFETLQAPLDLVLRNLIDNAVKHHDRSDVLIEVSATDSERWLEIIVQDDGPGIDRRHHGAVLLPFRTLENGEGGQHAGGIEEEANPSKGYGIGLAMVKRTLDTLGGSLRLDSNPAKVRGSRFTIKWPKTIKALP